MIKEKMMLQSLEAQEDTYRIHHPRTADMDIEIFRAHCCGMSVVRIATDTPCSTSTVYRSIRRVRDFLSRSEQMPLWNAIRQHAMDCKPDSDGQHIQSLLNMLYEIYTDHCHIDIGCGKTVFVDLHNLLRSMPECAVDAAMGMVCDLCLSHEQAGFTEGVKIGIRLADELRVEMGV